MKKKIIKFIDPAHFTKQELTDAMINAYIAGEENGIANGNDNFAERTKRVVEACEDIYKPLIRKYNKEYYDSIDEIIIE